MWFFTFPLRVSRLLQCILLQWVSDSSMIGVDLWSLQGVSTNSLGRRAPQGLQNTVRFLLSNCFPLRYFFDIVSFFPDRISRWSVNPSLFLFQRASALTPISWGFSRHDAGSFIQTEFGWTSNLFWSQDTNDARETYWEWAICRHSVEVFQPPVSAGNGSVCSSAIPFIDEVGSPVPKVCSAPNQIWKHENNIITTNNKNLFQPRRSSKSPSPPVRNGTSNGLDSAAPPSAPSFLPSYSKVL